ncbi:hypothetical protein [Lysobacter panacisoli]|nr:hypothetical protein [Lysobacter panacisoli]
MTFRFVLQPTMALLMAIRDGFKDAKIGRAPYFWTIVNDAHRRRASLDEGIEATARILALGLVMEIIYQYRVFGTFHVLEAVNFILLLCFIPYLVMRGPINRLAHWWMQRRHTNA